MTGRMGVEYAVWIPKYRFRVLHGTLKEAVEAGIQAICGYAGCELVKLSVQSGSRAFGGDDPAKGLGIGAIGRLKGQTSIKMFQQFRGLKKKPYWGNHFWANKVTV